MIATCRLSLRMSSPPSPPQALAELPTGAPPNVLVVGAAGVGKSALIGAMSSQAAEHGLVLAAAEGLPSGRALEAYAKVARTPSPAPPHPGVPRVEGPCSCSSSARSLAGAAGRDRVGGLAHPTAGRIRAAIRGADASGRGQPVALRGGGVQQDGRRPLSDTAAGWCARRPPRCSPHRAAPHASPRCSPRRAALLRTPRRAAHSARRAAHPAPRVPRTHPRTLLALQSLATRSRSSQSVRSEARTCGTSLSCWSPT